MIPKDIKRIYQIYVDTEDKEVKELLRDSIKKINLKYSENRYTLNVEGKPLMTDDTPTELLKSNVPNSFVWDNLLDIEVHF